MNLKEDKDKILEMLTSKDLELRKLAIDYIRNNYDIDIIVPFFAEVIGYYELNQIQTAEWQLNCIREEYVPKFMIEILQSVQTNMKLLTLKIKPRLRIFLGRGYFFLQLFWFIPCKIFNCSHMFHQIIHYIFIIIRKCS